MRPSAMTDTHCDTVLLTGGDGGAGAGVKGKLWATFIPAERVSVSPRVQQPRGVSIVARDFQTVALYKADGTFAGIRRPDSGKPIEVRALPMLVMGASGLAIPLPKG